MFVTLRERPFDFYGEGWKIYFSLGIFFTILYPGFLFFVKEDPGFFFIYFSKVIYKMFA